MQDAAPNKPVGSTASRFWRELQSLTLRGKLLLAGASASSYWWIGQLADQPGWSGEFLGISVWMHVIAVIFGALVMAPYVAASRHRILLTLAMCIASAVIYYLAVLFVTDGPFSHESIVPFLLSGGGAALLVGLTVVVLAPQRFRWSLLPLTLAAGIAGGAAFDLSIGRESEFPVIAGHLLWQTLVCVALHLGLRPAQA